MPALPLGHLLTLDFSPDCPDSLRKDLRLLALSEKALISAYLAYRDCIPDYNYACATLAVGELYLVALFKLGHHCTTCTNVQPHHSEALARPLYHLSELAKRYILKAVDVLKREREQNRNTYHLISESSFNLGDLLLIRLALLPEGSTGLRLFGPYTVGSGRFWQESEGPEAQNDGNGSAGDRVAEDLRRQIWEAYTQGLVLVQNEIDEYASRFRAPPEAYYAYRNLMDPVLHFRIARACRMRHLGGRPAPPPAGNDLSSRPGFVPAHLHWEWEQISRHISTQQAPQKDMTRWFDHLENLHKQAERVRSDRSPLSLHEGRLSWVNPELLAQRRLVLFHEFYHQESKAAAAG